MTNMRGVKLCMDVDGLKPNYSALGRAYGVDRRTAKKMYNGTLKKEHRSKSSKLDKHVGTIKEKLSITTNMNAIYKYIIMNIDDDIGSYSNFRKYINKNKELLIIKDKTAKVRFETDYGNQLQFDWKGPITLHYKNGEEIKFYIFSATLCASRLHCYVYSKFMTIEEVERCLIEGFNMIGGVPEECLTDNMSSIINYSQKEFVPAFKTFAKDMEFIPKHCKVCHAWTKGKDESCNRFMTWLLPYDYEFNSEEELIEILKRINNEINKQPNQTTGVSPISLFQKEKEYLQPLPNQTIIENYLNALIAVKVQNTMLFYYKGCEYSVPQKFIGQTLKVKENNNKLYVYYNKKLITTHEISNKKINYHKNDYIEGLSSSMPDKTQDQVETLAEHNLELLNKLTK